MVSCTVPTFNSALMVAVNAPVNSTPSRLTMLKPVSVKVMVYEPGRGSTIWYWPAPSVTAERTFSIKTGLAASTVTPGSTAPEASFTVPAIDACANAVAGIMSRHDATNNIRARTRIAFLLMLLTNVAELALARQVARRELQVPVILRRILGTRIVRCQ